MLIKTMLRICLALLVILASPISHGDDLTLGIVPQQSATTLAKTWVPFTAYLSKKLGKKVVFATAPNIPEFERRISDGDYDIAYMNPYHYSVFSQNNDFTAIAKQAEKRIHGLIVVHKDSKLESIEDLSGHIVAFPAPASFAATLLPQAIFKSLGITVYPEYVGSHDSVYSNVAKELVIAGGGIDRTFNNIPEYVKKNLKVLWRSEGYTPHAFAARSSVSETDKNLIQNIIVGMSEDEDGRKILNNLGMLRLEKAEDKDWDDVRSLNFQALKK